MDIIITGELKDYLKKKKKNYITLDLPMRKICCSGPYIPFVKIGLPKIKEGYRMFPIDGVEVYVNLDIKYSRKTLTIDIRKTFGIVELYCYDPENICVCGGNIKKV